MGLGGSGVGFVVFALGLGAGSVAFAADMTTREMPDMRLVFAPKSLSDEANPLLVPARAHPGLVAGPFLVAARFAAGPVYDSNIFNTNTQRRSDVAWQLRPSFVAESGNGLHQTLIYGAADAKIYTRDTSATTVAARFGVSHTWEVQRDLVVRAQADFLRTRDITNAGQLSALGGSAGAVQPISSNTFAGQLAVEKSFGRFFTALGGSFARTSFDNTVTIGGLPVAQSYRDNQTETVSGRVGAWVGPVFYAFAEPTGIFRQYSSATGFSSRGIRMVGGIGSDRIGLMRGEVFAGYLARRYDSARYGTVSSPVVGGRLWYYPLPDLTLLAQADQSATEATFLTASNPDGAVGRSRTAQIAAVYSAADLWSATLRGTVARNDYTNL